MKKVQGQKRRKHLIKSGSRKRLLRSDEPIIDTDLLSARMEDLMKERRNSDTILDEKVHSLNKDPMRSIWYWSDALIHVDLDTVFPRPWFDDPIDALISHSPPLGSCMHYLDVLLLAAYTHCAKKYGASFTELSIIKVTFKTLMSLRWEDCESVRCSPTVANLKRMLFFIILSCEPGFQRQISKEYESAKALSRFTGFLDKLGEKNLMLFNTPFSSHKATTQNNVGNVVNNYISDVMQTCMLSCE